MCGSDTHYVVSLANISQYFHIAQCTHACFIWSWSFQSVAATEKSSFSHQHTESCLSKSTDKTQYH